VEGALCLLLAIFWVATVSVVTDSRHGIAVDEYGAVSNGNLCKFSLSWLVVGWLMVCQGFLLFIWNHSFVVIKFDDLLTHP